jgi:hypothetical protein
VRRTLRCLFISPLLFGQEAAVCACSLSKNLFLSLRLLKFKFSFSLLFYIFLFIEARDPIRGSRILEDLFFQLRDPIGMDSYFSEQFVLCGRY